MKLRVSILRVENIVLAKVLEQDEDLRDLDTIAEKEGYRISSALEPGIEYDTLWVRGREKECDNVTCIYHFDTKGEAINWCKNIRKLIDEINDEPVRDWDMEEY